MKKSTEEVIDDRQMISILFAFCLNENEFINYPTKCIL